MAGEVYITEAADRLDRRVDTLRKWDTSGVLPERLRPSRGARGWRYWTEDQMEGLAEWAEGRQPGSALPGYNPDAERLALHRRRMRKPKRRNRTEVDDGDST